MANSCGIGSWLFLPPVLEREVAQGFGIAIDDVHQRVVHLLGLVAALAAGKEQQIVGHHFGDMTFIALLVLPGAALETSFDIDLGTFVENALGDVGQTAPAHHIVPFGDFYSLIVAVATVFGGGEGEGGFLHGHGPLGRESDYIRIFSNVTYKDYFVNSNHTYFLV